MLVSSQLLAVLTPSRLALRIPKEGKWVSKERACLPRGCCAKGGLHSGGDPGRLQGFGSEGPLPLQVPSPVHKAEPPARPRPAPRRDRARPGVSRALGENREPTVGGGERGGACAGATSGAGPGESQVQLLPGKAPAGCAAR